jgi:hypothetical protein
MPPEKADAHEEILRLTRENNELIKQNHEYLRKMYRNDMIGLTIRIIWYSLLIGLPFALYFYVLGPYFEAFGSNYELFKQGIGEIPGLKGFEHFMPPSGEETVQQ